MDLSISIVNWNVKNYLEKCLESIFKYSNGIDFEVIVVDNASRDNSVDMVKEKFPQVALIENKENIGYGCAHNQVIPQARGRYILFLNPDTEVMPDTLSETLKFMEAHPEAGVCKCRTIKNKEDTGEIVVLTKLRQQLYSFCKAVQTRFPNPITAYCCMNLVAGALTTSRMPIEQTALEGGFLFVRMEALKQAGGFNPAFLHSGEGANLTRRIRKLGWKLYRNLTIEVIHYRHKSSEQISDSEFFELEKNRQRRISLLKVESDD